MRTAALVSAMARSMRIRVLSAYMMTWPSALRAARPMVWMSERWLRRKPLVGIQDGHERHLGQVKALAQKVDAHEHVELAPPQVAEDLHALEGGDVGACSALHALVEKWSVKSSAIFLVSVVISTLVFAPPAPSPRR